MEMGRPAETFVESLYECHRSYANDRTHCSPWVPFTGAWTFKESQSKTPEHATEGKYV